MNINKTIEEFYEAIDLTLGIHHEKNHKDIEEMIKAHAYQLLTTYRDEVIELLRGIDVKDADVADPWEEITPEGAINITNQQWRRKRDQLIKELSDGIESDIVKGVVQKRKNAIKELAKQ